MQTMLDGEIDSSDYKSIKGKYDQANVELFLEQSSPEINKLDYTAKIHGSFNLLTHLHKFILKRALV
jgi:hypothetical protein